MATSIQQAAPMNDGPELRNALTADEQRDILRETIIHFLKLDPHHPLASFFRQALADLN
ncbi:hypothetical protein [Sphingomonas sp. Leaf257]|jgi:hypothetical protein|uniref:hypothetical protein n=1 Tax=Sphingomonas sp. Leaf257 TaxID=1736309 RepID=UPI0012E25F39|nr:hypothetical protein [Sphingomonas sp. Leaf257]